MRIARIQYTLQPDFVEQNKKNIEAVMQELRTLGDPTIKYSTYVSEDGKTFTHFVHDSTNGESGLPSKLASFKHFQSSLEGHYEVPPKSEKLELVNSSYDIFPVAMPAAE